MQFNQRLAVTSAGIALGFTGINANPSQAATVTTNFNLTGISGTLLNQQVSGSYSYDDSTTPTIAPTSIYPPKYSLTDFSLSILGENYSVANFSTGAGYAGSATGLLGAATRLDSTGKSLYTHRECFTKSRKSCLLESKLHVYFY